MAELPTVHEIRHDPLVDRYVIIAEDRALRPGAYDSAPGSAGGQTTVGCAIVDAADRTRPLVAALQGLMPPSVGGDAVADRTSVADSACPFCPGNEHETPPELFALRDDTANRDRSLLTSDWQVRVVTNKYPALSDFVGTASQNTDIQCQHDMERNAGMPQRAFPTDGHSATPFGVHEVIIESSRHITRTGELTIAELAGVLRVYRHRMLAAKQDPRLRYGLIFKNVGRLAGASIEHLHSQFMALSHVPPLVQQELQGVMRYYKSHGTCYYCQLIEQERRDAIRLIAQSPRFVAFCPFAARLPYETWILPREHGSHFEKYNDEDLADLADLFGAVIRKIETLFHPCAYNLFIHTSPFDRSFDSLPVEHYHWHIEIVPRMTVAAGFEWATGCAINTVSPERAAAVLRASGA